MNFLVPTPKGAGARKRNETTTIPCAACGLSFTGDCGRDAMILLIKHLRENRKDLKHQVEFDWIRNEALRLEIQARNTRCRTRLKVPNKRIARD